MVHPIILRPTGKGKLKIPADHHQPLSTYDLSFFSNLCGFHLRFLDAHLAMKRHQLGRSHGISLETLLPHWDHDFVQCKSGNAVHNYQLQVEAQIVEGELLFAFAHWMWAAETWDLRPDFDTALNNFVHDICPHLTVDRYTSQRQRLQLPELVKYDFRNRKAKDISGKVKSCAFCYTDYQVHIFNWRRDCPIICVRAWQNFGKCETLDDPKWKAITERHWNSSTQRHPVHAIEHEPGSIKESYPHIKDLRQPVHWMNLRGFGPERMSRPPSPPPAQNGDSSRCSTMSDWVNLVNAAGLKVREEPVIEVDRIRSTVPQLLEATKQSQGSQQHQEVQQSATSRPLGSSASSATQVNATSADALDETSHSRIDSVVPSMKRRQSLDVDIPATGNASKQKHTVSTGRSRSSPARRARSLKKNAECAKEPGRRREKGTENVQEEKPEGIAKTQQGSISRKDAPTMAFLGHYGEVEAAEDKLKRRGTVKRMLSAVAKPKSVQPHVD
ncbi:hypothetical protein SLS56_001887 [Neofusicoccum ribis]|uniref:Uncharacterized protein n=1 Tax=Neofusicoccum ribis TaxID=45134 RepID=A0ABR3T6D1_9PEZI